MSKNKTGKEPWDKEKLVGQKLPLKLEEIWGVRIRLEIYVSDPRTPYLGTVVSQRVSD